MGARCKAEFWDTFPEMWVKTRENTVSEYAAMERLNAWLQSLRAQGYAWTWVAWPAAFDWMWLKCTWDRWLQIAHPYTKSGGVDSGLGKPEPANLGYMATCIDTMFDCYCQLEDVKAQDKDSRWEELTDGWKVTHRAIEDARCQAAAFIKLNAYFHGDLSYMKIKLDIPQRAMEE
jgi:hypothetical protein